MTDLARVAPSHPIAVLREQIAPDATDGELAYFAQVCARLNLSPFADQIVLIGRWDSRVGAKVHRHQITVAGRRTLAARTGNLVGIEGPVWCGPRVKGELVWSDVWDDDTEPPYCARVLVHVRDWVTPTNGTAKWSEFVQRNRDGTVTAMWQRMPSHMLGKVAESMALRRAFPDAMPSELIDGFAAYERDYADDYAELAEAEATNPEPVVDAEPVSVTPRRDTPGAPVAIDQAAAHRIVGAFSPDRRAAFLERHHIDDFSSVWPPEALADVAGGRSGSPEPDPGPAPRVGDGEPERRAGGSDGVGEVAGGPAPPR